MYGWAGFSAGLAIGSGGLGLLSGSISEPEGLEKPRWTYEKIDSREAADIAYENWYKNFCTYAVVSGILLPLQEKVGEPYTLFPIEAFRWGHGGAVGWGTLCGTLTGAGIVTGLIAGEEGEQILNDLIYWYTKTELPVYTPETPKARIESKTKSGSPLCHVSSGKWMKKERVAFFSPERKERCARVAADVAARTVELLNEWADGRYVPVHGPQVKNHEMPAQNNCGDCHETGEF